MVSKRGIISFAVPAEVDEFLGPVRRGEMDGWTLITIPGDSPEIWKRRLHDDPEGLIMTAVKTGRYVEISDEHLRHYFDAGECVRYRDDAIWELTRRRQQGKIAVGVID